MMLMATCAFHIQITPKQKFHDVIGHYTSCILLLTYLVLPTVSTFIFGAFGCINIDPSGVMPGTPMYLRHDYRCALLSHPFPHPTPSPLCPLPHPSPAFSP